MSSILHILDAKITVIDNKRGTRHYWWQGSKGCCHGNQILRK